jgi:hypothetical protein
VDVPCLDRDAFDFVVEERALFVTACGTAAGAAEFERLKSRAISDGGALATCGEAAAASDAVAGETGCTLAGSNGDTGGGCGGWGASAGESAGAFPRCAIASTTR